jgi:hypothetical protein
MGINIMQMWPWFLDSMPTIIGSIVITMGGYIIKQIRGFRADWQASQKWKEDTQAKMEFLTKKNTEAFEMAKESLDLAKGLETRVNKIKPMYFHGKH